MMEIPVRGIKLNIGSGGKYVNGFLGVDASPREGVDIVADASSIPLPDECAVEVMALHLIEHLLPWDLPTALGEWFRLLRNGGKLIIEAPDIIKGCRNVVSGYTVPGTNPDRMGMWAVYGDVTKRDPLMLHKYGYSFNTLAPLVAAAGFVDAMECATQTHKIGRLERDFRLEARK